MPVSSIRRHLLTRKEDQRNQTFPLFRFLLLRQSFQTRTYIWSWSTAIVQKQLCLLRTMIDCWDLCPTLPSRECSYPRESRAKCNVTRSYPYVTSDAAPWIHEANSTITTRRFATPKFWRRIFAKRQYQRFFPSLTYLLWCGTLPKWSYSRNQNQTSS